MEIIIETSAKHFVTKIIAPKDTFNILINDFKLSWSSVTLITTVTF